MSSDRVSRWGGSGGDGDGDGGAARCAPPKRSGLLTQVSSPLWVDGSVCV